MKRLVCVLLLFVGMAICGGCKDTVNVDVNKKKDDKSGCCKRSEAAPRKCPCSITSCNKDPRSYFLDKPCPCYASNCVCIKAK